MAKEENKYNYEKDERVLCYHGPTLYEAKILKREKKDEGEERESNQYFVHYKGWKQTWDEWIAEDRVLKHTEANLQKQRQLKEMTSKRKPSRASSVTTVSSAHDAGTNSTTESRSRKRHRDSSIDKARMEEETKRPDFKLTIPDILKGLLVDDWENVTKNQQVLSFPREITVDIILESYKKQCEIKSESLDELLKGVLLYFNKILGMSLLYSPERKQYEDICIGKDKTPSSVFGAEHLLRLFVEIPNLISETNIDMETSNDLREMFEDLFRFILDHEKDYFVNDYQPTNRQ